MRKPLWKAYIYLGFSMLLLLLMASQCTVTGEQELRTAIGKVFPELGTFELVQIDDAPIIANLRAAINSSNPVSAELPILDDSGKLMMHKWIAYHVDVRDIQDAAVNNPDANQVGPANMDFSGPSNTFRGIPDWNDKDFLTNLRNFEEAQSFDETMIQPSVLNIIGGQLEGAYYGNPNSKTVSVFEGIQNLLEPQVGAAEAQRLAGLTKSNYLVYRQQDFQPNVAHGEVPFNPQGPAVDAAIESEITPQNHTAVRILRPVMVADSSIYDPDTNTWSINNWFDRVDAAVNRQNAYLWLVNIASDIPSSASSLASDNNRIYVRSKIAGYLVLTKFGKSLITFPTQSCGGSGSFVDVVRKLSNNFTTHTNEYWMWWTRNYGGGCAYISTLGKTPQGGAVGWAGFGGGSVDWTSFVFMHESGHILGGTHVTNAPGSPETFDSHRCKLFGFWPIGPTGPSLMSYASGTRTYCFAATPSSGTPKKNLTKVAEYLHTHIQ